MRDLSVYHLVISPLNIILTMCSYQKARSSFVSVKWIIMAVVQVTPGIQRSSWSPFSPVSQEFPLSRPSRAIPPSSANKLILHSFPPGQGSQCSREGVDNGRKLTFSICISVGVLQAPPGFPNTNFKQQKVLLASRQKILHSVRNYCGAGARGFSNISLSNKIFNSGALTLISSQVPLSDSSCFSVGTQ